MNVDFDMKILYYIYVIFCQKRFWIDVITHCTKSFLIWETLYKAKINREFSGSLEYL